jgi:hypothetical protein
MDGVWFFSKYNSHKSGTSIISSSAYGILSGKFSELNGLSFSPWVMLQLQAVVTFWMPK